MPNCSGFVSTFCKVSENLVMKIALDIVRMIPVSYRENWGN